MERSVRGNGVALSEQSFHKEARASSLQPSVKRNSLELSCFHLASSHTQTPGWLSGEFSRSPLCLGHSQAISSFVEGTDCVCGWCQPCAPCSRCLSAHLRRFSLAKTDLVQESYLPRQLIALAASLLLPQANHFGEQRYTP